MLLENITLLTHDTLMRDTENAALIFLAPRLRSRNALMAWFIDPKTNAFFFALLPEHKDLSAFLAGAIESLRDFAPKFGDQTSQAVSHKSASPKDLAEAFSADLKKAKPRYLILDNFDYLTVSKEVLTFFQRLAESLPSTIQIVINSRNIAYENWSALVRSGKAVILGDEQTLDGGIFDPNKPDITHLEVYGLAGGNVYVNGLPMTTWDGPLPRNLFYYFVDHPMVTRDDIFETFWPDLPTKEATNVFHVTKRKISERLGYELTSYAGGFYRPSGQMDIHYDVQRFETNVKIAEEKQNPTDIPIEWYNAIKVYRGAFLHGIDMPWIKRRREELRLSYTNALIGVGRLHKMLGEHEQAVSYYLRALRELPEREDIHRDIMTIYMSTGESDKAVEQYRLLVSVLKEKLNITPSKATRNLYNMIIGGESK